MYSGLPTVTNPVEVATGVNVYASTNKTGNPYETYSTANNNTYRYLSTRVPNAPSATVSDITVSGISGTTLLSTNLSLTLADDYWRDIPKNTDVSSWLNLPAGLSATVKSAVSVGSNTMEIIVSGTPTALSAQPISVTIPAAYLVSGQAVTSTANANARWDITNPVTLPPATGDIATPWLLVGLTLLSASGLFAEAWITFRKRQNG